MLPLYKVLSDLKDILENRDSVLESLIARPIYTPGKLFKHLHLPLLITYPIGILTSPFTWYLGWSGIKYILIFTIVILFASLLLSIVTDKISETSGPRTIDSPTNPTPKNVALYMHLPLASIGLFYFFHPIIGLLSLMVASFYCFYISIESISLLKNVSRARAFSYYLHAIIFFLIPVVLSAFLYAIYKSLYYIFIA